MRSSCSRRGSGRLGCRAKPCAASKATRSSSGVSCACWPATQPRSSLPPRHGEKTTCSFVKPSGAACHPCGDPKTTCSRDSRWLPRSCSRDTSFAPQLTILRWMSTPPAGYSRCCARTPRTMSSSTICRVEAQSRASGPTRCSTPWTVPNAPYDREHVTPFVKDPANGYRVLDGQAPERVRRPDLRLSIDTPDDLVWMERVFARAGAAAPTLPLALIIRAADALSLQEVA